MRHKYDFPHIENADEKLKELALAGIETKYGELQRAEAQERVELELINVRLQGSASGYLVLLDALRAGNAKQEEFFLRGEFSASVLSYAVGLTAIDPLNCEPKLYPIFFFGPVAERLPSFELVTTPELRERMLAYFKEYPGEEPVNFRYYDDGDFQAVYIGELKENDDTDERYRDTFHIQISTFWDKGEFVKGFLENPIVRACSPDTYADYVKCYGFTMDNGVWENNAELLVKEGKVPFADIIAYREDVYEYLVNRGVDEFDAYEIAYDVQMGRVNRRGWTEKELAVLKNSNVPSWWKESCEKILNLWPRGHVMTVFEKYYKDCPWYEGK